MVEKKLFLTMFLIYSLFAYWTGSYSNSFLALTRAIVEENTIYIDNYYNTTIDWSFYNGHYYLNRQPGLSFVSVPVYSLIKDLDFSLPRKPQTMQELQYFFFNTTFVDYIKLEPSLAVSMFVLILVFSALPSALLCVLFFRVSKYFIKNENIQIAFSFVAGLSTMIFPYATVYMQYSLVNFMMFFAFYLVFKMNDSKEWDKRPVIIAGIMSAFSFFLYLPSLFFCFMLVIYLFFSNRKIVPYLTIGLFLGSFFYILYHTSVFGLKLDLLQNYNNPNYMMYFRNISISKIGAGAFDYNVSGGSNLISLEGILKSYTRSPYYFNVLLNILFLPFKGIFIYYPIIILSFYGLFFLQRRDKFFIALLFFSYLLLSSIWLVWWGGSDFSTRNMVPTFPFLVFSMAPAFEKLWSTKWKSLIIALALYCLIVNLSGFHTPIEPPDDPNILTDLIFEKPLYINPLFHNYIPDLLIYGPRSRLIESFIMGKPLDIRYSLPEQRESYYDIYIVLPYLPVILLLLFMSVLWKNELPSILQMLNSKKMIVIILLLLVTYIIYMRYLNLTSGLYLAASNEEGRWSNGDFSISFYSLDGRSRIFELIASSYLIDREVSIHMNGELLETFVVRNDSDLDAHHLLETLRGVNTVYFNVKEDCMRPAVVEGTNDTRCLSIHLWKYTITEFNGWSYGKYWYPKAENEEGRWFAQNATILLFPQHPSTFRLTVWSMLVNRTLNIYLNDQLLTTLNLQNNTKRTYTSPPVASDSTLRFETIGDCVIPADLENGWDDYRCLGIHMSEFDFEHYWEPNPWIRFCFQLLRNLYLFS